MDYPPISLARSLCVAASLLAMAWAPGRALADGYPERPIRLLVGFPAGSTNDAIGRLVGEALTKAMGQPAIVENRAGANGSLAVQTVAKARPDGYTLLVSNTSSITVNPLIYKDLPYDPERDLAPITTVISYPLVLTVSPASERTRRVTTVKELVQLAKSAQPPLNYGSAGIGNLFHITAAQFNNEAGIAATHVPYRGGAPMQIAVMAGEVDYAFDTLASIPLIKDGRVRALAVTEAQRWRELPDVPTMDEAGFPKVHVSPWMGVFAPKGTPPDVLRKVSQALALLASDKSLRERMEINGRVDIKTPEAFQKQIAEETALNKVVVRREGISQ